MAAEGRNQRHTLWWLWVLLTLGLTGWLVYTMFSGTDKTVFMPGPLSPGHHQLALACDACHTDPLGGGEVLQKACVGCHGNERVKPFDSHPAAKFKDPRNADRLEKIDALVCTTCHVEHKPEITVKDGLTQPKDFCAHCHADIAKERPSHEGMPFDSCKDSGCHNFHNNRALYTDFLIKHLHEPDILNKALLPEREFGDVLDEIMEYPRDRYPLEPLEASDADTNATVSIKNPELFNDWLGTAHAGAGVNCTACHQVGNEGEPGTWNDRPGADSCQQCHDLEVKRFGKGKHGMRLAAGLAPMTPAEARLPMHADASHLELTCNSCHPAHRFDVREAAVESCLTCHDGEHSRAYKISAHYRLWQSEEAGDVPPGSGVSCAGCHMPRISFDVNDWMSRIMVDHNQSANLSPNSKMLRSSCLHCHGLEFSISSLADPNLVAKNFSYRSDVQVKSMELAEQDHLRALRERQAVQEAD